MAPAEYHQDEFYIKPPNNVLRKMKAEKVIQIENRAKVKAVKEDTKVGATDMNDNTFKLKKMNVPEIKEALMKHGLMVNGNKAKQVAGLQEHFARMSSFPVFALSPHL